MDAAAAAAADAGPSGDQKIDDADDPPPSSPTPSSSTAASAAPQASFKRGEVDYRRLDVSLLPLISPADALKYLAQEDCVLVDVRTKEEHNR